MTQAPENQAASPLGARELARVCYSCSAFMEALKAIPSGANNSAE